MKLSMLLVLLANLLAFSVCPPRCITKNKFLTQLATQTPIPIDIFKSPSTSVVEHNPKCGAEWKVHGTCCNPDDLEEHYKLEELSIKREFIIKTQSVTAFASMFRDIISRRAKLSPHVEQFLNTGSAQMVKDYDTCRDTLLHIRGSALCSVCSGRSQIFFNRKKDKLLIDMQTCQKAVEACGNAITMHSSMLADFGKMVDEVMAIKSQDEISVITYLMYLHDRAVNNQPPAHLVEAFANIKKAHSPAEKNQEAMAACSLLVDVVKKPFVTVFSSDFTRKTDLIAFNHEMKKKFPKAYALKMKLKTEEDQVTKDFETKYDAINNSAESIEVKRLKFTENRKESEDKIEKLNAEFKTNFENLKNSDQKLSEFMKKEIEIENKYTALSNKEREDSMIKGKARLEMIHKKKSELQKEIDSKNQAQRTLMARNPVSRSLFEDPSFRELLRTADSQVLLKVDDSILAETKRENHLAFVVPKSTNYEPANMTLTFP